MNKEEIITPEVGMGAFTGFNGDRYPYTIVDVVSPKKILVTADSYKVKEKDWGFKEGPLDCEFTTNWDSTPTILTLRKNGRWVQQGLDMNSGFSFYIGRRAFSQNPHF
jgi:hypothetical protein